MPATDRQVAKAMLCLAAALDWHRPAAPFEVLRRRLTALAGPIGPHSSETLLTGYSRALAYLPVARSYIHKRIYEFIWRKIAHLRMSELIARCKCSRA